MGLNLGCRDGINGLEYLIADTKAHHDLNGLMPG
jgi:hypothetical protein